MSPASVGTTLGRVSGVSAEAPYDDVTLFRGIPYAAPPTGALRWAPPADPEPWQGVRACSEIAPGALQLFYNDWFQREGYVPGHYNEIPPLAEDCLYLNVATTAPGSEARLPVLVWFHGGGLTSGFAVEAPTDPVVLASKGLVVVHVAQRLNTFGYLALPQLRDEQGTSGNYGFLDQLKAMDWIHHNIRAFGGDPDNITVAGQSGGSQKAAALAAVPRSIGHVRRVISSSGLKWMQPLVEQSWAEQHGLAMLEAMGIPKDASLDELRALDAEALMVRVPRDVLPDYMVRDDVLPYDNLREGFALHAADIDFMNGLVLGEGEVFARAERNTGFTVPSERRPFATVAEFRRHFDSLLSDLDETPDVDSIVDVTDETAWTVARRLASLGLTGSERTNISRNLMLNRTFGPYIRGLGGTGRVFDYLWSHRAPASPHDVGTPRDPAHALSWHGVDTWYLFGATRPGSSPGREWQGVDVELADIVTRYVVAFALTGDPNGPGLPRWPEAGEAFGYIDIGDYVEAHDGLDGAVDRLIRRFVVHEYALEGLVPEGLAEAAEAG